MIATMVESMLTSITTVTLYGINILSISSAVLLIATFGVVVRRGFIDWLGAYQYQSFALSAITAIMAYTTAIWQLYIAAALTLIIKCIVIPKVLQYATRNVRISYKIETHPYISIRSSVIVSALLVALSFFITQQVPVNNSDPIVKSFLPVSLALFLIGLFIIVIRRVALNQIVGLLIIENGMFLFTVVLTRGVSILVEVGILVDIMVGVLISAILLSRMGTVIESMDVNRLTDLRED
jgi:hydrogenase-4 component E